MKTLRKLNDKSKDKLLDRLHEKQVVGEPLPPLFHRLGAIYCRVAMARFKDHRFNNTSFELMLGMYRSVNL